ncbi:MAG: DUF58 domain-containing protein [Caulobacteraceae bacterium]|nr:DUF58 domain-containing protein [Caulobacteraceae bacterium]
MIYPTARAIGLAAIGAPIALLVGLTAPGLWLIGPGWIALVFALVMLDAALGADRARASLSLTAPGALAAGGQGEALVQVAFAAAAPAAVELALEANARIEVEPRRRRARVADRLARTGFRLKPIRRGPGALVRLWARWPGPMGLVWKQKVETLDRPLPVTLNIQAVKDEALKLFTRDALAGPRLQFDLGGGSEFHALSEFRPGMDRRSIDWKQSARHRQLLAREFHVERNHPIILVVDTGRLMCEPLAGLPKIDHALNAALVLAYVGLKSGDRVGLFAFDAKPHVASGALSGPGAYALIQRLAAGIDYSTAETNFTLGLTQLSGALRRRSLLVVFTDFADTTSAELMLENVGRLMSQHLVLFVVMRDDEMEALTRKAPEDGEDVSRAVVAAALLREREVVIERLRRMGAEILEAPAQQIGAPLLARYLDLKRRDLL